MKNIAIFGHTGMVGSAITKILSHKNNLICPTRQQLDLTNQIEVVNFFKKKDIDEVYIAAARVGGIFANNAYPGEFIYENTVMQINIIHAAYSNGIKNLLFLGSSCIYPKLAKQPIKESYLLSGALEETNEPYAIAKIAGIKMCESYNRQYNTDFRCIMPTNLYGPNDNFHPKNSHVIPAMMRRFHLAKLNNDKEVIVWGTGNPMREFLHVDDMASASVHIMNLDTSIYKKYTQPMLSHINIGTGIDCSIKELAETMKDVVGFHGQIVFDTSKPDGTPRKLLDVSRVNSMGWKASIDLRSGLESTYKWFIDNIDTIKN